MNQYALGHTPAELKRLEEQGRFYGELTTDILTRAGVDSGMQVLDVGCGAGDVSLLVASLVGAKGRVLGIDKSLGAVEAARQRAASLGIHNVSFTTADVSSFASETRFDAIVGRLVLLYLSDPALALRNLKQNLRPGGVMAFVELDLSSVRTTPELQLFNQCVAWMRATFERSGAEVDMGTRLHATFVNAGLAPPKMLLLGRVEAGQDSPVFENLTQTLRSLLPMMQKLGVATKEQVGIDSLAARLRAEATNVNAVVIPPCVIGAWTKAEAHA
jgi:ubiquinone/menaquinone biosynthesis C-methylase UbiE